MNLFMLDTNAVSAVMHGQSARLDDRMGSLSRDQLCVSALTYGETIFGLRKRPAATRLHLAAQRLFDAVDILSFDIDVAASYGELRAMMEAKGTPLGPMDMLIAAHALSAGATLVSADRAFRHVPGLYVEDWTAA